MDLSFSNEQENFRKEVRNFLRDNLKPNISSKMKLGILLSKDEILNPFKKHKGAVESNIQISANLYYITGKRTG